MRLVTLYSFCIDSFIEYSCLFSLLVVGVSGATCSGKSTLSRLISQSLPGGKYLNQDDFYFKEDYPE